MPLFDSWQPLRELEGKATHTWLYDTHYKTCEKPSAFLLRPDFTMEFLDHTNKVITVPSGWLISFARMGSGAVTNFKPTPTHDANPIELDLCHLDKVTIYIDSLMHTIILPVVQWTSENGLITIVSADNTVTCIKPHPKRKLIY